MTGRTNAVQAGGTELTITVSVTTGATVIATKGLLSVSGVSSGGSVTLKVPEVGEWIVSATLSGQTSDTQTVNVVDNYSAALTFFTATITVNVDTGATVMLTKGGISQTKTSTDGTAVFTVTETGAYSLSATLSGQTVTGSIIVVDGITSYTATLEFIYSVLNDNSWSVIKGVSDAGQGANYWAIGDKKAVTLDGTVLTAALSDLTTYAFIIGFDHNPELEGSGKIHFQLAKTDLSGGADVCIIGPSYGATYSGYQMNTTNTKSGGWASSNMRVNILGTSLTSYSNNFISILPDDLRTVLKAVTKYTDNVGSTSSTTAANVTETTDYLFLLAEYEVYGTISRGTSYEGAKQAQYAYYSSGNSKIKYKHDDTTALASWWLRSPACSATVGFVLVGTNGAVSYKNANYSFGLAPGFCV